jgi:hypothetical protein
MGGVILRLGDGMGPIFREERAEEKGGGIPPSRTSGFSWRTILLGVVALGAIVAIIALVVLLLAR